MIDLWNGAHFPYWGDKIPQGWYEKLAIGFWDKVEDHFGYMLTIRIKDWTQLVFIGIACFLAGAAWAVRTRYKIKHSDEIKGLGTVKVDSHILSDEPKNSLEFLDMISSYYLLKFSRKKGGTRPTDLKRAKKLGRILAVIVVLLVILSIALSSFIYLGHYRKYMMQTH